MALIHTDDLFSQKLLNPNKERIIQQNLCVFFLIYQIAMPIFNKQSLDEYVCCKGKILRNYEQDERLH